MKQMHMSSSLGLYIFINISLAGCAGVQQPPPQVQPPKPAAHLPEPKGATANIECGIFYFDMGRYELTLSDISQVITLDPKITDAYSNWGDSCLLMDRYDETVADFSNVIEINPNLSIF